MSTNDTFFKPGKVSARDKAHATDEAAWSIINTEASERERKTEALRALREKREAEQPVEEVKPKPAARKTVRKGRQ
jgi:hypothetical protein